MPQRAATTAVAAGTIISDTATLLAVPPPSPPRIGSSAAAAITRELHHSTIWCVIATLAHDTTVIAIVAAVGTAIGVIVTGTSAAAAVVTGTAASIPLRQQLLPQQQLVVATMMTRRMESATLAVTTGIGISATIILTTGAVCVINALSIRLPTCKLENFMFTKLEKC